MSIDTRIHTSARRYRFNLQHFALAAILVTPLVTASGLADAWSGDDETTTTETAILAGGCFWGMEGLLRDLDGVVDTEVGYASDANDKKATPPKRSASSSTPTASATKTSSASTSRCTTRRPRTVRATTAAPSTGRRSSSSDEDQPRSR